MDAYRKQPHTPRSQVLTCAQLQDLNSGTAHSSEMCSAKEACLCQIGPYETYSDESLTNAAIAAINDHRYTQALLLFTCLIERHPTNAEYCNNRGLVFLWNSQIEEALEDFQQAIQLSPDLDKAYNNRGNCYTAQHRWNRAIADYERALDLNPFNIRARINLGITLRDLERYDEALEVFEEALLFRQLPEHIYGERGRTYQLRGDWNCAIADYNRALSILKHHSLDSTKSMQGPRSLRLQQQVQSWLDDLLSLN